LALGVIAPPPPSASESALTRSAARGAATTIRSLCVDEVTDTIGSRYGWLEIVSALNREDRSLVWTKGFDCPLRPEAGGEAVETDMEWDVERLIVIGRAACGYTLSVA
jgi:hypothetical protein